GPKGKKGLTYYTGDCENGEDEEHCLELEEHECDSKTQSRCKNGLYIDKHFFVGLVFDCLDWSDETDKS
ncbi:unnamed protein product, partial [Didymodactylos carnosus]